MVMLMYHAPDYMFMLMGHYMDSDMGMLSFDGTTSTMRSKGVADTLLTAQFKGPLKLYFDLGISFPTGSIDVRGPMTHSATFFDPDTAYPYGMQLGSGTRDYIHGVTYKDGNGKINWGAKYEYTGRVKKNKNQYKLGDVLKFDAWVDLVHSRTLTSTIKVRGKSQGQIEGANPDPELDPTMSPAMDPMNYGGNRIDLAYKFKWENDAMSSASIEATVPVSQDLYGPQMKTEWIVNVGVGYMF